MSRVIVYPFSMTSQSDARLVDRMEEINPRLDVFRVYPDRSYVPRAGDLIVGWGAGDWPAWRTRVPGGVTWLNGPVAVSRCVSKTTSFNAFREAGVRCIPFTTSRTEAATWALEGNRVMARNVTEGRDGEGAVLLNTIEEVRASRANLYTLFLPKHKEFRVHVFGDRVIGVQERVRRDNAEITNYAIRTSENGWGLTRNWDVQVPDEMKANAILAVRSLGLNFGAVDIGVDRFGNDFVFEANSAPEVVAPDGIDRYSRAILAHVA